MAEPSSSHIVPRGRVLVMDDEANIRELVSKILSRAGFEVSSAADGQQALDLIRAAQDQQAPFLIALLDLHIENGLGGYEIMPELRRVSPATRIVVASGADTLDSSDHSTAALRDAFLPKPFHLSELRELADRLAPAGAAGGTAA